MQKTASISQAKNRLSELIRGLESGPVILLDRGRPVARLEAIPPMDAQMERLVRKGLVIPAAKPFNLKELLARPLPKLEGKISVLDALLQEREEGW